jgi:uncharacterized protein (TIGR03435 family)
MRLILVAFAISAAFAQHVEFEVASVKPAINAPFGGGLPNSVPVAEILGFEGGPGSKTPGRIHYSGVTLKMILVRAYAMRPYQILGPGWMDTERYDIDAKYPGETMDLPPILRQMVKTHFSLNGELSHGVIT